MDIIVPHSWLKDYLKTDIAPEKIGEYLSLCGPSVGRVEKKNNDTVYSIEVTTNRIDSASVYGVAREAAAILSHFDINAVLQPVKVESKQKLSKKVDYLDAKVDHKLCKRFAAILIKNVRIGYSPDWIKERLLLVGSRPINNIVDISNYIMFCLGQPVHTFDYDKIRDMKMILRESKNGEEITTLDGKTYSLPGGDIVIEDGSGELIDLAGIMGGKNSAVDKNTKNVLLFVQIYDPIHIRKTSIILPKRTDAVAYFERSLDPEQVETAIRYGIDLFVDVCKGTAENQILDLYPNPYENKVVSTSLKFIQKMLGVEIKKDEVQKILTDLGFKVRWDKEIIHANVPSYRSHDINIEEDLLEEVARIYGYFNLPSTLMTGRLPEQLSDSPFGFEKKIKELLKGWGATEIATYSLVSKDKADIKSTSWVLKLKNPLGADTEYLRLSLAPSLDDVKNQNLSYKDRFHLFEMSNVYLPVRGHLPEEKMTLAGIFAGFAYDEAKGIVESLFDQLRIKTKYSVEDLKGFKPSSRLVFSTDGEILGQFGIIENSIYYEFDVQALKKAHFPHPSAKIIPKYPGQLEDISLVLPKKTFVGDVITAITAVDHQITNVELKGTYENTKTFRITYQNLNKTLTDKEVEEIRKKLINKAVTKFSAKVK